MYLFIDNMIVYVENLTGSTIKLLIISKFSKATGYKINIQNSTIFLYTSNNQKLKIKAIPFTALKIWNT